MKDRTMEQSNSQSRMEPQRDNLATQLSFNSSPGNILCSISQGSDSVACCFALLFKIIRSQLSLRTQMSRQTDGVPVKSWRLRAYCSTRYRTISLATRARLVDHVSSSLLLVYKSYTSTAELLPLSIPYRLLKTRMG
jgi:hypothetical protein